MEWQHDHGGPDAEAVAEALVKKLKASVFKAKTCQWVALRPMEGAQNGAKASEATTRQGQTTGLIVEQKIRTGP
ncbi:MAG: hypothetical protein R3B83_06005 [Nitrospirales bacterium]|nr:hypothetical protein [Nitrospirales bacterium]